MALPFDGEAVQVLRLAGRLATGRVEVEHLRQALAQPPHEPLPATNLRLAPPLLALLERAADLAQERGQAQVARVDLAEALAEAAAGQAGLDLERLRFARWLVARRYPEAPRLRQYRAEANEAISGSQERADG
jgi:hypothetical protein